MYYSFIDDAPLYGSMKDFVYDVKTQFFSLGGTFADFDSFKFYLLEQAVARTTLSKPRYKLSIDFAYATMSINDVRLFPADFPGNDLTYPEAYLFVRYLIDNYGIDKVLACCLNYDFEMFFNQMFDEAFVFLCRLCNLVKNFFSCGFAPFFDSLSRQPDRTVCFLPNYRGGGNAETVFSGIGD